MEHAYECNANRIGMTCREGCSCKCHRKVGDEGFLLEDVGDLRAGELVRVTNVNKDGTVNLDLIVEESEQFVDQSVVEWS